MCELFIAYEPVDRALVDKLDRAFRKLNMQAGFDNAVLRRLPGPKHHYEHIADYAGAVIACWSPNAMESYALNRHVAKAAKANALACVLAAPCPLPSRYAHLDAPDLSRWNGALDDSAFQRLLKTLGVIFEDPDLPRTARLRVRGEQPDVVAVLRTILTERVLDGAEPMTKAQALSELAKRVGAIGIDDVGEPLLSGALAELTEQNCRRGEPPLGALIGGLDFFNGHSILWAADRRVVAEVLEDCLFRIRQWEWFLDEC